MDDAERFRLLDKYRTSCFRIGGTVVCEVRGQVVITGMTDALIPWPIAKGGRRRHSLIVYKDLVETLQLGANRRKRLQTTQENQNPSPARSFASRITSLFLGLLKSSPSPLLAEKGEDVTLPENWSTTGKPSAHEPNDDTPATSLTVEEIIHRYAPCVYRVARRMLGRHAGAEDVAQGVLLRLIHELASFPGEAFLTEWLYRVTVHAVLAQRHKQARQREEPMPDALVTPPANLTLACFPVTGRETHGNVSDEELQESVEMAMDGLPERYRDVFVLADVEARSLEEIAALLDLGAQAVRSRLHHARLCMCQALGFLAALLPEPFGRRGEHRRR
jgi:RNA polymerase sigma-70 factor, ECF subfamily